MEETGETRGICREGFRSLPWFWAGVLVSFYNTENLIFRSINFCNGGINLGNPRNLGMLLSPLGNLSHTSILYYHQSLRTSDIFDFCKQVVRRYGVNMRLEPFWKKRCLSCWKQWKFGKEKIQ
jgi:hypothetical protein